MLAIKQLDRGHICQVRDMNVEVIQEFRSRRVKFPAHHQDALQMLTITLGQRLNQFPATLGILCFQPLLELVEHNQHFFPRRQSLAKPQ